jgi:hypothetical protein
MRRELESDNGVTRRYAVFNDQGRRVGTDVETIQTPEMQQENVDRQTLADYEVNPAPTPMQTTEAIKALIRLRR